MNPAARRMLQLPLARQRALVIVVFTTSVHPRDLARLEALPVAGILSKPRNQAKVQDVMHTHFSQP